MIPLYKTTIVIWSRYDPTKGVELEALPEAAARREGAHYSIVDIVEVQDPEKDPDWDGTDFFNEEEEG